MDIDIYTPQASVIGAILMEPKLMGEALLDIQAEDFSSDNCRIAWQAMAKMFREGTEIDPVLLRDALIGHENANAFLRSCMELAPAPGSFSRHVAALKKQAMLEKLKQIGDELTECTDIDEAMKLVEQCNRVSIRRQARERRTMSQMLHSFGERHSEQKTPDFLKWPMQQLNDGVKVAGGKFVVIGGYPSDGKTAFALSAAMTQAKAGKRAALYSFETDADTVEDRMLANLATIDMSNIKDNKLTDDEWARYAENSAYSSQWPFEVIAASGMTVDDIRADALANHFSVIYIDYLQLINPGSTRASFSRFDEVSEISRKLQQLAKTTGITVVALSQMSRPAADKKGNVPPPTMHNLRESGQIEQDADVIMLLYRKDHKDIRAPRYLDIAKNKEGRTGHFQLTFDGKHQQFREGPEEQPEMKPYHRDKRTPVLGTDSPANEPEQMQFPVISGEDASLPF